MCRVASITLADDTQSPGRARAWTESRLDSWEIDDQGVTTLLVSELVTNAVKHARATSTLTLAVATGMIEVGVTDTAPSRRVVPVQRDLTARGSTPVISESGRGLMIVQALAADWGVTPIGRGKQVWFRRPVAATWPYSATCLCATHDLTAHHLPSGHQALHMPGHW
jgi:anti-sigma regulatory factor (Ser/Thr protein kinase)